MGRPRQPIKHGTVAGNRAHFRHGVPMCEPCRAAERRRRGYQKALVPAACGTRSGYHKHLRSDEEPCGPCRDAAASAQRAWKQQNSLPPGDPRHGTLTGYSNWLCRCAPCKAAGSANNRRRRLARSARASA